MKKGDVIRVPIYRAEFEFIESTEYFEDIFKVKKIRPKYIKESSRELYRVIYGSNDNMDYWWDGEYIHLCEYVPELQDEEE